MSKVIHVFERLGELDWYALRPGELATGAQVPLFPPLITLRYKSGNEEPYRRLVESLRNYNGTVKWSVAGLGGKNICLMPDEIHRETLQGIATMDAVEALIDTNPSLVELAIQDFARLISHFEKSF